VAEDDTVFGLVATEQEVMVRQLLVHTLLTKHGFDPEESQDVQ